MNIKENVIKTKHRAPSYRFLLPTIIFAFILPTIQIHAQHQSIQQPTYYTVYGRVKDVKGNPLGYAAITVYDASGAFVTETRTFSGGGFSVMLQSGTYRIQIEKEGYERKPLAVSVSNDIDLGEIILDYALGLSMPQTYIRMEAFSEASIPLSIENKGSGEESITISIEAPREWNVGVYSGSAEVVNLTLSPGSVQSLTLKIQPPYTAQGIYNLTVRISGSTVRERTIVVYVKETDLQILSSTYPMTQATPGSTVVFDLTIRNVLAKRFTGVLLLILPDHWSGGIIKSDGSSIQGVSLGVGESVNAKVKLEVPDYEIPQEYEATVLLRATDFESKLSFKIIVVKGAPKLKLYANTPYVDAYAGNTARYLIMIENRGSSDGVVNISVKGLPSGYGWLIKDDSGNVLSKVYLKAGESKNLNLFVNIPPLAEPNIIPITLEANSEDSAERLSLSLGILGFYSISYVTQNFYCEATAGESIVFQVEAKNTGYSSLSNLILGVSDIPDGFSVKVSPELVSLLKPQESAVFSLTITGDADVSPGDYYITLSLKADQSQAPARSLHVYVKQKGETVLIGVVIVVIMAAATFMIYRRYGRR
ncbi:MAG: NEW3 domain-containing protein [Thermoproteota archaeon]|nr:carboxypeptidase regulatory-like domain-containing protein [Candidatus Brockarchaeota archaeon]